MEFAGIARLPCVISAAVPRINEKTPRTIAIQRSDCAGSDGRASCD